MKRHPQGNHRKSFAILLLVLMQGWAIESAENPLDPVAGKHVAQENRQLVWLVVGGQRMDLSKDAVAIADYFAKRPPDALVAEQMRPFLTEAWANRGTELRKGMLTLPLFKATPFPNDPTWAENPFKDDYWMFSLHSMLLARYLIAAHHTTRDDWYVRTLELLVRDWISDNTQAVRPSPFSWNDHSTAMRLENLLYTFEYVRTRGAPPEFLRDLLLSIHLHCSILADEAFYSKHSNHGLDQSYRLYWAAAAIPEFADAATWREIGKERTVDELAFALSDEGVQVENSPAYHFRHLGIMAQVGQILSHYEQRSLRSLLGERLSGALKYGTYILKPDGHQPILGDTQDTEALGWKEWLNSYADVDGFSNLVYSITAGARGVQPTQTDMVFKKSGYAIFRDQWKQGDSFKQTVYLALKAGFLSANHRHQDDLSILLYGYGEDWLIDSGLYRYQENDPMRLYVKSAEAHNLATVDEVTQICTEDGRTKCRIDSFVTRDTYASVTASHELYPGYRATRKLDYFKPARVTIEDEIIPSDNSVHTYRVLFHVPTDKRTEVVSNTVAVYSSRSARVLRLHALRGNFGKVYTETGVREPHYQGWVSHVYDQVEPSTCIAFETSGRALKSLIELQFSDPISPTNESYTAGTRSDRYAAITIDVECRKGDSPTLQRRAIFGDLEGKQYGLPMILERLAHHHAKAIFFVDFSMFYFAEPLLAETIAYIRNRGHDVALHLHWNQVPPELQKQRAVVLHEAANYFRRTTGERPKAYRGGSYVIDDAIASALRDEGVLMDFSFFMQNPENCSFYKTSLGNAFGWYEGLYAVPVTTMPGKPTQKLDINWLPANKLLPGVRTVPVPVLFLHSFSFMTPWNDWKPSGVAESLSGTSYRREGDGRLSQVDRTAQQLFEMVLDDWGKRGVRTLGLDEISAKEDELAQITGGTEKWR